MRLLADAQLFFFCLTIVASTAAEEEDRGELIHFHACGSARCNVNETFVVSGWTGTEAGQLVIRQSREQLLIPVPERIPVYWCAANVLRRRQFRCLLASGCECN